MIKTIIKKLTKTHPLKHGVKKASSKIIKKKLDILWSLIVKKRAGGVCEVCGKLTNLNSHHIVGRRVSVLRWDVRNGCCLCVSCHRFSNTSAHNNGTLFDEWMINNRPKDRKYVLEHHEDLFDKDFIRIENYLKDELKEAENDI